MGISHAVTMNVGQMTRILAKISKTNIMRCSFAQFWVTSVIDKSQIYTLLAAISCHQLLLINIHHD